MVAHFNYWYKNGHNTGIGVPGVTLIPAIQCGHGKVNNTDDMTGSYASTTVHTTTCPAIASALSNVLGSYLLSNKTLRELEV